MASVAPRLSHRNFGCLTFGVPQYKQGNDEDDGKEHRGQAGAGPWDGLPNRSLVTA
jgi:hypothetical protein